MSRNPSELQRLIEEHIHLIERLVIIPAPKAVKENWLKELRAIERELGIKGVPYNASEFGS
jgi:hypothetical protein